MKRLQKAAWIGLVVGALFLKAPPSATAETATELLARVAKHYTEAKRYRFQSVEVLQLLGEQVQNVRLETEITVVADEPNHRYRLEVRNPFAGLTVVSDGKTVVLYDPIQKTYRKEPAPRTEEITDESPLQIVFNWMSLYRGLDRTVQSAKLLDTAPVPVGEKTVEAQKVEVVFDPSVVPRQLADPRPKTLYVDPKSATVVRLTYPQTLQLGDGTTVEALNTTEFRSIQIDEDLPAELFTFVPPEDAVEEVSWVGREAPDFTLPTLDGETVQLSKLRGKVVLLNFWASWCGPCRAEMPDLQKVHETFAKKGLVVLGVNNEVPEKAQQFVEELQLTFPTVSDQDNAVFKKYQVRNIPTTLIIDREGTVVQHLVGAQTEEGFRKALSAAGIE